MLGVGSGAGRSGKVRSIVKNGLQAWHKYDKDSLDYSKNSNHGTLYTGKALEFDGIGDYVDVDGFTMSGNAMTFALSVKSTQSDDYTYLLDFNDDDVSNNNRFIFAWNGNVEGKISYFDNGAFYDLGDAPNDGEYHRLVFTINGNTIKLYVDSVLQSTKTTVRGIDISNSLRAKLFTSYSNGGSFFNGTSSDIQLYNKAWTASDALYDWEHPEKDVFDNVDSSILPTDCKALYRLNEGYGDKVYNSAPVLGEELILSTELDDISEWTNNLSWFQFPGLVLFQADEYISKDTLTVGGTYKLEYKGSVSDSISLVYPATVLPNPAVNTVTTHFFTATDSELKIQGGENISILDYISIKQITPASASNYADGGTIGTTFVDAQRDIPQLGMCSYSNKAVFDGVDDNILIPSPLSVAQNFTMSAWCKINDLPTLNTDRATIFGMVSHQTESTFRTFEVAHWEHSSGTAMTGHTGAGGSNYDPFGGAMMSDKLNLITVSLASDGTVKSYVNGILMDSEIQTAGKFGGAVSHVIVGGRDTNTDAIYNGFIDEVSLFSGILSQEEVQELYNSGTALDARDHSKSGNLAGYWRNNGVDQWDDLSAGVELLNLTEENVEDVLAVSSVYPIELISSNSLSFDDTMLEAYGHEQTSIVYLYHDNDIRLIAGDYTISGRITNQDYTSLDDVDDDGAIVFKLGSNIFEVGVNIDSTEANIPDDLGYFSFDITIPASWQFKIGAKDIAHPSGSLTDRVILSDLSIVKTSFNPGTVNGSPETIILQEGVLFGKDSLGLPMNKVRQRALNLDGTGYVEIDDDSSLDFGTGSFSVDGWVKFKFVNTSSINCVYSNGGQIDVANTFGIGVTSNKLIGRISSRPLDSTSTFVEGEWIYFAITRDNSGNCKLYINDNKIPEDTATQSASVTSSLVKQIGRDSSSIRFYHDLIDDIKLYNEELSASQINKNYKATKSKHKNNLTSNWSDDFSDSFI